MHTEITDKLFDLILLTLVVQMFAVQPRRKFR